MSIWQKKIKNKKNAVAYIKNKKQNSEANTTRGKHLSTENFQ